MGARPPERHPLAPRLHAPVNGGPPAGAAPQTERAPPGLVWEAALARLVLTWALIACKWPPTARASCRPRDATWPT